MPQPPGKKITGRQSVSKRVLLVDDHAVVRFGMAQILSRESDLAVCGEQEDATQALTAVGQLKPDVAIIDISLKDSSGLELIRNLKAQHPALAVLVVSSYDEAVYAEPAFRAGALGYLMKGDALDKLVPAVRRVLSGNIYVSEAMAARLLDQQIRGKTGVHKGPTEVLSDRELEVFQLLGEGLAVREIAKRLHVSVKTVEAHRTHIKEKLHIRTSPELLRYAIQSSLGDQK